MFSQQPVAQRDDRLLGFGVALGLYRQIAFRIETHRTVAQIGSADNCQPVIDEHYFRMDINGIIVPIQSGIINPQTIMSIGLEQAL